MVNLSIELLFLHTSLCHPNPQDRSNRWLRHRLPSPSITILTATMNQESPQPVAQITRTAEADDCFIHCPAHRLHLNSNFSPIQSGGSISPQSSISKTYRTDPTDDCDIVCHSYQSPS
ncbi:hypothetical protein TNCV_1516741 [Trichonephila clavipes]|nr:hypothetical protein TNCV_1516741 [Trichonephila clavipes]